MLRVPFMPEWAQRGTGTFWSDTLRVKLMSLSDVQCSFMGRGKSKTSALYRWTKNNDTVFQEAQLVIRGFLGEIVKSTKGKEDEYQRLRTEKEVPWCGGLVIWVA